MGGPMNARTAPLAIALAILALSAVPSFASQSRWGLTLGGGKTPPLINGFGGRGLATMSVLRSVTNHVSLQTRATYIWSHAGERSAFAPLGLGVRIFGDPHPSRQSGVFLEAAPSVFISRWADSRGSVTAALPGIQVGGGFQIPTSDDTGIEFAALYLKSKDFGPRDPKLWPTPLHQGMEDLAFHAAVVMGL
jgi:hypothetical protein